MNEGFATLFDYMIPGILYPEWRMRDFFNVMTLQYYGFQRDVRETTLAMTTPTLTLEEISDAFSAVAYDKGESRISLHKLQLNFVFHPSWSRSQNVPKCCW